MARQNWRPGNMLYPLPAVLVSCQYEGIKNCLTVAWAGTICSDPAMVSISVRKERFSYHLIEKSKEFVVNLTTEELLKATDYCGVKSGRDVDKFKEAKLTVLESEKVSAPSIAESPVCIECKVVKQMDLGSHTMFLGEVVNVSVDDSLLDEKGTFHLNKAKLVAYSHGRYHALGKQLGTFGFSVVKKRTQKKKQTPKKQTQKKQAKKK